MGRQHTEVVALAAEDCGAGGRAEVWEEGDGGDGCAAIEPVLSPHSGRFPTCCLYSASFKEHVGWEACSAARGLLSCGLQMESQHPCGVAHL